MHRHKRFRHGGSHFGGFFWVFIFMMMFSKGHWWPGILLLIGLAMVFGSFFRDEKTMEWHTPPRPSYTPTPPLATPKPAPASVEQIHPIDLLPATCTHCGGPIRSYEVKWTGSQTAACPYCGSNLKMKK